MVFKKIEPKFNFGKKQASEKGWNCAKCGREITELPFEPAAGRPIYCRGCWMKYKTEKLQQ